MVHDDTTLATVAVFGSARAWIDDSGTPRGRRSFATIDDLGPDWRYSFVLRSSRPHDGGARLTRHECSALLIPWRNWWSGVCNLVLLLPAIFRLVNRSAYVVSFLPGLLGSIGCMVARLLRRPSLAVAVGDPQSALSRQAYPGLRGALARTISSHSMGLSMRKSNIARYVTREYLQGLYPPGPKTRAFSFTDVLQLEMGAVREYPEGRPIQILTVGSLDQPYKGIEELIRAVADLVASGYDLTITVAGDGRLLEQYQHFADSVLPNRVAFLGNLGSQELQSAYRKADVFVLASWTEGLPRALLEAMAAGLPSVATAVGGIPELLEPNRLAAPRDPHSLQLVIARLLDAPIQWESESRRNLRTAQVVVKHARTEMSTLRATLKGVKPYEQQHCRYAAD